MLKKKIFSVLVIVIMLILTALSLYYIKKNAHIETNLDKYMPQKHPAFVYSNKAEEEFNIKDAILFVVSNEKGIYNKKTLNNVKKLSKELKKIKGITKITSLYTADNIVADDGSLTVKRFYKRAPSSENKLNKIKKAVESNEMIYGRIVSKDENSTLVIAEIKDNAFTDTFYEKMMNIAKKYNGHDKVMVAGRPIIEGTMGKLGPKDMKKMVPIVFLVIIVILFFIMRSFRNTFFTILVVGFSTIWTFGLMSAMNIPIYAVSIMIPVMLIAIGVADGIHIYSHMTIYKREHPNRSIVDLIKNMYKELWRPVVMTSVTTAIGFISLLTSEVYPIKYFGMFTAFGVMSAMVLSLVLIPAGVLLFNFPKPKKKDIHKDKNKGKLSKFLHELAGKVIKHKIGIVITTVIILIISGYGITKVWIDSSFLKNFEENSEIVQIDHFVNKHFGGTSTLNVILDGKNKDTFKRPEVLRLVNKLQKEATRNKMIGNSFALTDYINRMNMVMHANNPKYNTIPDSKNAVAQYLLLYEMSGDPDNLWKTVDYDYKKMNLVFQLKNDSSKTIKKNIAIIKKYKDNFKKLGITIRYAGSGYKALVFTELILEGQIKSLVISLLIILILISLIFKNIVIGIIGSVPIIITAAINFGIMGLLNIPLSSTTALLSSISVGIGIDYAIHFIERYKIYSKGSNNKLETASQTMDHSGRAIIFNAFVVISGFLVLTVSVFPPNRELGALVSLNMFTSFIGTITIMLLLLFKSNIYFKDSKADNSASTTS